MLLASIVLTVCFLAGANGANDNFKGVASLFGSRSCGYRTAIAWGTLTTFAGSVASTLLAKGMLAQFSGKGLVRDALVGSPSFLLAVAAGAAATVVLATRFGFPVSTTHGLTGALVGAGLAHSWADVRLVQLGGAFVVPLIVSPALAAVLGALVHLVLRFGRFWHSAAHEKCLCAGIEENPVALPDAGVVAVMQSQIRFSAAVDGPEACSRRYPGMALRVRSSSLLRIMHFGSAGAVSFARGLNDTPKISALLLAASAWNPQWGLSAVGLAMGLGGLLGARRVADTMSHKLTGMDALEGLAANLTTALLVTTASFNGLPVSTTHVSVGSLIGMGSVTGRVNWRPVLGVLASWVITLPCAALVAAVVMRAQEFHP